MKTLLVPFLGSNQLLFWLFFFWKKITFAPFWLFVQFFQMLLRLLLTVLILCYSTTYKKN
jgi:hypothetical protein